MFVLVQVKKATVEQTFQGQDSALASHALQREDWRGYYHCWQVSSEAAELRLCHVLADSSISWVMGE